MIPSISYPEAMAKFRAITLKDQLKYTVKTLHKAGAFHIDTSEDLILVDRITPEKELINSYNILTNVRAFLCTTQTLEQADTGDDTKPVYTIPFREFRQDGFDLNKWS